MSTQEQRDLDFALALSLSEEGDGHNTVPHQDQTSREFGGLALPISTFSTPQQPQTNSNINNYLESEQQQQPSSSSFSSSWWQQPWSRIGRSSSNHGSGSAYETAAAYDDHMAASTINNNNSNNHNNNNNNGMDDWNLARTLQLLEFEMNEETAEVRQQIELHGEFEEKEYNASSWKKQVLTLSTLICVVQICIYIAMMETEESGENTAWVGPSVYTLLEFGAKDAALILYRGQWWRLFTPILLHGSLLHLLGNVFIQLRIGGYLNLVFGTPKWTLIYVSSGVFGNVCSCLFLPDAVSVGSSGAVLGLLTAWMTWIVFRWKKVPREAKSQRNCQLSVVLVSVAITLAFSFTPAVDWAAHFGGALMGLMSSIVLVTNELDNERNKSILRYATLLASLVVWAVALIYLTRLEPARDTLEYF